MARWRTHESLTFLRGLKRNNRRDWFNAHRDRYDAHVRAPMIAILERLGDDFRGFAPELVASPNASMYRISRDVRFSEDKAPYKTHVRTMDGRLVDMQPNSNQAVLSGRFGQQNVALSQVARIYFGGNGSANQYGNPQNGNYGRNNGYNPNYNPNSYPPNGNYGQYGNRGQLGQPGYSNINRTVTVPSNQLCTNTGINVQQGQVVHFQASGNVSLSQNAGDVGTPAGANSGRLAGNSSMPNVTGGMLIGRVNNGPPFAIGAQSDVTMPASGRLSLGINDDYVQDNSGNFIVNIR
jgi:Conserved hypothetical protein (DUF2461)